MRPLVVLALAVVLAGCDWSAFGFDATHSHFNANDTSISILSAHQLQLTSLLATGAAVSSSPAVLGGVVYVGSSDHHVDAFDANGITGCTAVSCQPLWSTATGAAVTSSPAVASGVVYVGSLDGRVYALDAKSGAVSWSRATGGPVASSPAVADGVVYVGSNDGKLYALDAATGRVT